MIKSQLVEVRYEDYEVRPTRLIDNREQVRRCKKRKVIVDDVMIDDGKDQDQAENLFPINNDIDDFDNFDDEAKFQLKQQQQYMQQQQQLKINNMQQQEEQQQLNQKENLQNDAHNDDQKPINPIQLRQEQRLKYFIKYYGYDSLRKWYQMKEYMRLNPRQPSKFTLQAIAKARFNQKLVIFLDKMRNKYKSKTIYMKFMILILFLFGQVIAIKKIGRWSKNLALSMMFGSTILSIGKNLLDIKLRQRLLEKK